VAIPANSSTLRLLVGLRTIIFLTDSADREIPSFHSLVFVSLLGFAEITYQYCTFIPP
jgi:hypothetical protein